jgi:hypothetical protein
MKITKQSSSGSLQTNPQTYLLGVDNDLVNIFTALKGRIKLGENIGGQSVTFTSSGTPNAEFFVTHGLGTTPTGFFVINKDKAGDLYASGTAWTNSRVAFKCSVASVTMTVFLIK